LRHSSEEIFVFQQLKACYITIYMLTLTATKDNEFVTSLKVNVAKKGKVPDDRISLRANLACTPGYSRRTCSRRTIYCIFLAR